MANKIQAVKGTREFYPEQMALRNFIYNKMSEAATSFGYQEWDAPFIEPIDLYAAKSGEELVKKQSFTFRMTRAAAGSRRAPAATHPNSTRLTTSTNVLDNETEGMWRRPGGRPRSPSVPA